MVVVAEYRQPAWSTFRNLPQTSSKCPLSRRDLNGQDGENAVRSMPWPGAYASPAQAGCTAKYANTITRSAYGGSSDNFANPPLTARHGAADLTHLRRRCWVAAAT
jgi:hypothetical protein